MGFPLPNALPISPGSLDVPTRSLDLLNASPFVIPSGTYSSVGFIGSISKLNSFRSVAFTISFPITVAGEYSFGEESFLLFSNVSQGIGTYKLDLLNSSGLLLVSTGNPGVVGFNTHLDPGTYIISVQPLQNYDLSKVYNIQTDITVGLLSNNNLFTTFADNVDFNLLTADQQIAVGASTSNSLLNSLGGNDIITLPDDAHVKDLSSITGVSVPYILNNPAYTFHGGAGADTFDFTRDQGLKGYAAGETLYIDGDTPAAGASVTAPYSTPALEDTLKLLGSPSDYAFTVKYDPNGGLAATHIVVGHVAQIPLKPVSIDTANIERVTFADPGVTNPVTLDKNNLYAEMARLCAEVYGPLKTSTHGDEPLASGVGPGDDIINVPDRVASTIYVGNRAITRGWHEVSALELGLPPGSLNLQGFSGLRWSFANGFYQSIGPTGAPSYFPTTEASALVLSGVVGGQRTLSVVFRGTDEKSDFGDYIDFKANHYAKFAPLVAALKTYVGDKSNQISQLLIGGHSLGGGVAQLFAQDMGSMVQDTRLFTFGSPGAETPTNVPQVNFFQTGDPVATVLSVASQPHTLTGAAAHAVAYAAAITLIGVGIQTGITRIVSEGAEAAKLIAQLQPKKRSGVDVPIGSDLFTATPVSASVLDRVFAEHAMGLDNQTNVVGAGYVSYIDKLVDYASDTASQFASSSMAGAIKSGVMIAANQAFQVGLGNGSGTGGLMVIEAGDRYDLGDRSGANTIALVNGTEVGTTPHDIDGGPGAGNQLDLLGGLWFWQQNGTAYDLYKVRVFGLLNAGTFQRIQTVSLLGVPFSAKSSTAAFASTVDASAAGQAAVSATVATTATFSPASLVTHLDGSATTVQQVTSGAITLTADGTSDVTYAGPGVTSLTSSAAHALLAYGSDTMTVTVTGGRATVTSDGSPGGTVAIDTGSTASFVVGGARAEVIRGHLAGAMFQGGSGDSTVAYTGVQSDYTLVPQADGSTVVSDAAAGSSNDRLVGINHVTFANQTVDLTVTPVPEPTPSFAMTDVTANISSTAVGEDYNGPVSYLQKQFIYTGTDKVALAAGVPNAFLHGGSDDDALAASAGSNVLDGGLGSNFLVGATGADGGMDTFYVDGRGKGVTWSTVVNFHHGDAVTLWGFTAGTSTALWTAVDGAQGYLGATIHSEWGGAGTGVNGSVTFANVSLADTQSKFTTSTGNVGGNSYLQIVYTG